MIALIPDTHELSVLCLGAHPDDVEIGCGGTLLQLCERPGTDVHAVIITGQGERRAEVEATLPAFAPGAKLEVLGLPDSRLPAHWNEVKDALQDVAARVRPDLILAPRVDDAHQDHRLVGRLVTTVWRDSLVLHYEIPKWDGDLFPPTHYVALTAEQAKRKVELLNIGYPSQRDREWWDDDLFFGLMRMRGIEIRSRYAEAFVSSKVRLGLSALRTEENAAGRPAGRPS
jgi:LmbE family N-acetylglucosaminyl deacetylase